MAEEAAKKKKLSKATRKRSLPPSVITQETATLQNGEVITVAHIKQTGKDINFERIFLAHIIEAISAIGNKKIKLLMFLFAHKNSENQIVMTQRQIALQSGISLPTVSATLKSLKDHNFLKKQSSSVYVINPNAIFRGNSNKRMDILLTYENMDDSPLEITKGAVETVVSTDPEQTIITKDKEEV